MIRQFYTRDSNILNNELENGAQSLHSGGQAEKRKNGLINN